jgi:hypothetical protein
VSRLPSDSQLLDPSIGGDHDGTIWITWHHYSASIEYPDASDNNIWLARSTDGGETFASAIFINGRDNHYDLHRPQLALDATANRLYVLFHAEQATGEPEGWGYNIFLATLDLQTNQTSLIQVNDQERSGRNQTGFNFYDGPHMSLTVRDGVLCAAWEDRRDRFAIYGNCSTGTLRL